VKLSRVIGTVVLSRKVGPYAGKTLHLTQGLNEALEPAGDPQVSAAWQAVREGELVIVEVARESADAFGEPMPFDSVILGEVESVHIDEDA
jgi:microcompartment protein CcmK/EutM